MSALTLDERIAMLVQDAPRFTPEQIARLRPLLRRDDAHPVDVRSKPTRTARTAA